MHELGIAQTILNRVEEESTRRGGARVTRVGLRVGELSGVDPEALAFGFEALAKDTALEGVVLEIDFCKRRQRCGVCACEFETDLLFAACPKCASEQSTCIAGDELDIAFMEIEEPTCA